MLKTRFTELVGCRMPVQLAAMPGVSGPDLATALADAGALATLGQPLATPPEIAATFAALGARTSGVLAANFLMPFLDPECIDAVADKVRLVEFFYDRPDPRLIARAKARGALASWQVGSLEEARAAEDAGCDLVTVQGTEAGGHVRGQTSLLPLLARVLEAVRVPVLAAGGIATARDLAAVLAAGASGARIGTRFVASSESEAHPDYVARLLRATAADTVLTEAFSVMWPDAPHRVLRSAVEAAQALNGEVAGETPMGAARAPVPKLSVIPPSRDTTGRVDAMALYAGESVGAVDAVHPAATILASIVEGAERLLAATAALIVTR
jgi:NAD(P)H-dependent flavin oxidoreductase YrpB (nitropropane dioxygenase family)